MEIKLKRAYDPAESSDGYRIYVDRLWPRGLSHATFHYDLWCKEIAPSDGLRKWFHEDPLHREEEFRNRYLKELKDNPGYPKLLKAACQHEVITLLYSSREREFNNATVLDEEMTGDLKNFCQGNYGPGVMFY